MRNDRGSPSEYWASLNAKFETYLGENNAEEVFKLTKSVVALLLQDSDAQKDLANPVPEVADVFDKVAYVLALGEKYDDAESFYQRALSIRRVIFGEEHPRFAASLDNLAELSRAAGKQEEADRLAEQAKGILLARVDSLNEQFAMLVHEGNYGEALPLAVEVSDISRRVHGEVSEQYAQALNNTAFVYKQIAFDYERPEYFRRAEQLYLEASDIWRQMLGEEHPDYAVALNNLGELYRAMGNYSAAEPLMRKTLELAQNNYGHEHPMTAGALNNLAALHGEMGDDAAAEQLHLQAVEIRRKTLGENHPLFAQSLNNLALVYVGQVRYAEAEPLFLRALAIYTHVHSMSHPEAMKVLSSLVQLYEKTGNAYGIQQMMERFSQALEAKERARPFQLHSFPAVGRLFQDLNDDAAEYLTEQTKHDEAAQADSDQGSEAFQESLRESIRSFVSQQYNNSYREAIRLNAQSPTHEVLQIFLISAQFLTGPYRGNPSERLHAMATPFLRVTEDEPWWHALLQLTLGQTDVAHVLPAAETDERRCQAHFYAGMRFLVEGQAEIARAEFNDCLAIESDAFEHRVAEQLGDVSSPIEDEDVSSPIEDEEAKARAIQLNNRVSDLLMRRQHEEAVSLSQEAYEWARTHFRDEQQEFRKSLYNFATALYLSGRYSEAGEHYEKLLNLLRGDTRPDAMALAACLGGIGLVHVEMGRYDLAQPAFRESIAVMEKAGLQQHPNQAQTLGNLAESYRERNDLASAVPLYEQALRVMRGAVGEQHPEYARWLNNLGILYLQAGHEDEAEALLKQALEIRQKTLPEDDPEIAATLGTLAHYYIQRRQYAEAEKHLQRCLHINFAVFGERSYKYAAALSNLALLYLRTNRLAEAKTELNRSRLILQDILPAHHPHLATALDNLAVMEAATGQLAEAMTWLEQGQPARDNLRLQLFAVSSERQKLLISRQLQTSYCAYLSIIQQLPDPARFAVKAYDHVLTQKAMTAQAQMAQRDEILAGGQPNLRTKFEQLNTLRMRIARNALAGPGLEGAAAHEQILNEWNMQREELEIELAKEIPEINLRRKLRHVTHGSVARSLPAGTAVVEYVRYYDFDFSFVSLDDDKKHRSHYLAFVLLSQAPNSLRMFDLGDAEQIDLMVADFIDMVAHQGGDPTGRNLMPVGTGRRVDVGAALRAAVFEPVVSALGGRKRLFIAPDGSLSRLPFEVLPAGDQRSVIDDYTVSYLSTGRDVLRFGVKASAEPSAPLVAADPDFDLKGREVAPVVDVASKASAPSGHASPVVADNI